MHFSVEGIGKFYVYMKLVLRDEEVEEVNFYSFVVGGATLSNKYGLLRTNRIRAFYY